MIQKWMQESARVGGWGLGGLGAGGVGGWRCGGYVLGKERSQYRRGRDGEISLRMHEKATRCVFKGWTKPLHPLSSV